MDTTIAKKALRSNGVRRRDKPSIAARINHPKAFTSHALLPSSPTTGMIPHTGKCSLNRQVDFSKPWDLGMLRVERPLDR